MMDEFPALKLIQAVDPTKIKVTINEKFSKLTLSSNKKKDNDTQSRKEMGKMDVEKRRSASRNLLEELDKTNDDDVPKNRVNVLLKSSSSDDIENTASLADITKNFVNESEEKNSTAQSMERLQISDEFTEQPNKEVLETLIHKISNMSVRNNASAKESDEDTSRNTFKQAAEQTTVTIDISSSSDDEESAIYISDTSEEENDDPIKEPTSMLTSDIVKCDETEENGIPLTLSNYRADRIEAFLKDVSQERRNIEATGGYPDDSIMAHLDRHDKDNGDMKNLMDQTKAKILATVDTESMTLDSIEGEKELHSPKKRNFILDDTEAMSESCLARQSENLGYINDSLPRDNASNSAAKRLANDETEVNTTSGTFMDKSLPIAEDSIIISETSSEVIEGSLNDTKSSCSGSKELIPSEDVLKSCTQDSEVGLSLGSINISARINIKLKIQANLSSSEDEIEENDSQDGDDNSDDVPRTEYDQKKEDISVENESDSSIEGQKSVRGTDCDIGPVRSQAQPECNQTKSLVLIENEAKTSQSGSNFMTQAEKLLTELYGNSWKTPEVIHTIKKTSKNIDETKSNFGLEEKASATKKHKPKRLDFSIPNQSVDQSVLDDFTTFQHDIVATNLDSTRLVTPTSKISKSKHCNKTQTETKNRCKPNNVDVFKRPQTEVKRKQRIPVTRNTSSTNERWRQLVDDDSDEERDVNKENITDDANIDETLMTDDEENRSNASDSSWRQSVVEITSDEDDKPVMSQKPVEKKLAKRKQKKDSRKDRLIYMDLSKDEVTVLEDTPQRSPPANNDENFKNNLSKLLASYHYKEKPRLEGTPKSTSKRRLFNVNYGYEDEDDSVTAICRGNTPKNKTPALSDKIESELSELNGLAIPAAFNIFNKRVEAVKRGKPVFEYTPVRSKGVRKEVENKDSTTKANKGPIDTGTPINKSQLKEICSTPNFKYGFLKSLDVCVGKSLCHPDALVFRNNYRQKKEDLTKILYELYNSKLFNDQLNVPITWNKKLQNTAGRCLNKKKLGKRLSTIELSEKVLTSPDRLRCTLIHELCHAATWIFDEEGGHGAKWKEWARKANAVFPDLPKIGVCHKYDIEYKYTYKCTLCAAKSHYHSKSKKVENIRCSYCHGAIEIFLNKKDKDGNVVPTPIKEPTGFAKFVKEKYQLLKQPDMKHADVMKLLSNEFAALKVVGNDK